MQRWKDENSKVSPLGREKQCARDQYDNPCLPTAKLWRACSGNDANSRAMLRLRILWLRVAADFVRLYLGGIGAGEWETGVHLHRTCLAK